MKNSIGNFPLFKPLYHYIINLNYKRKTKQLSIGYSNDIRNSKFGGYNNIGDRASMNNVTLGTYTYMSYDTVIRNADIGKFCSIGPRCLIGLGKHPVNDYLSTHPLFYSANSPLTFSFLKESTYQEIETITIGNDVWLGAGCIILDGVSIGDGAIVAAGAVVTKNVAPFSIVKGVPAKHSGYKFTPEKIKSIQDDPWWDKDIDWIKKHIQEPKL
ncbi:antibiotic acetyltransferase [Putridiphycobacter roseus]|uniref:Antibiotic acetyltransferase n=1 Tax=Putridiphycobacter roseus TaxID=2219161 RepID=A0A2W1NHZ9_9FLAO|nr:CatB-related O-acetyltransferase [Putridiphycobacter roseus]PZE18653.1 antibiotic acetyltransferase [Putridiphycobacter roseus]